MQQPLYIISILCVLCIQQLIAFQLGRASGVSPWIRQRRRMSLMHNTVDNVPSAHDKLSDILLFDVLYKNIEDLRRDHPHILQGLRDFQTEISTWSVQAADSFVSPLSEWRHLTSNYEPKLNQIFGSVDVMEAYFYWRISDIVYYDKLSMDPFALAKTDILKKSISLTEKLFAKLSPDYEIPWKDILPILLMQNTIACQPDELFAETIQRLKDSPILVPESHQVSLPTTLKKKLRLDEWEQAAYTHIAVNEITPIINHLQQKHSTSQQKILSVIPDTLGKGLILDLMLAHTLLTEKVVEKVLFYGSRTPSGASHPPTVPDIKRMIDVLADPRSCDVWSVHYLGQQLVSLVATKRIEFVEDADWDLSSSILSQSEDSTLLATSQQRLRQSHLVVVKGEESLQKLLKDPKQTNNWKTQLRPEYNRIPICSIRSISSTPSAKTSSPPKHQPLKNVVIEMKG
jgi:hypothetical protein